MHIVGMQVTAKPGQSTNLAPKVAAARDAMAAATGQPFWAWAGSVGEPWGTFAISSRLDGFAALIDAQAKMVADPAFQTATADLTPLITGPAETTWNEVLAITGEPSEPKQFLSLMRGQINIDGHHLADAIAWSRQVLELAHDITGVGSALAMSSAGSMFEVSFINSVDTAAEVDARAAALAAAPKYGQMLEAAGGLFATGSIRHSLAVQLP